MKKLLKSVAALSLSAMMLLSPGVLAEEDEEESNVVELTTVVQEYEGKQIVLKTAGLDILEQDGYIQSKRRQGAFVLDVSDKPGVSISSTAEIVTSEYLKRCFELGMSLEDIEQQFALSLNEAKTKRDAG